MLWYFRNVLWLSRVSCSARNSSKICRSVLGGWPVLILAILRVVGPWAAELGALNRAEWPPPADGLPPAHQSRRNSSPACSASCQRAVWRTASSVTGEGGSAGHACKGR